MKNPFAPGDQQTYTLIVDEGRLARFDAGLVHPVYSTFALAKDAEWTCRLFVLAMKEAGEEGIGSFVSVNHRAPAVLGSTVTITATLVEVVGNRVECRYQAHCGTRLIAEGTQTQHIIDKAKFEAKLQALQQS